MKKLERLIEEAESKYLEQGIDKFSERQKIAIRDIANSYAKQAFSSAAVLADYQEYLNYLNNLIHQS